MDNRVIIGDKIYQMAKDYAEVNNITIRQVYNQIKAGKLRTRRLLGKQLVRVS